MLKNVEIYIENRSVHQVSRWNQLLLAIEDIYESSLQRCRGSRFAKS